MSFIFPSIFGNVFKVMLIQKSKQNNVKGINYLQSNEITEYKYSD